MNLSDNEYLALALQPQPKLELFISLPIRCYAIALPARILAPSRFQCIVDEAGSEVFKDCVLEDILSEVEYRNITLALEVLQSYLNPALFSVYEQRSESLRKALLANPILCSILDYKGIDYFGISAADLTNLHLLVLSIARKIKP